MVDIKSLIQEDIKWRAIILQGEILVIFSMFRGFIEESKIGKRLNFLDYRDILWRFNSSIKSMQIPSLG